MLLHYESFLFISHGNFNVSFGQNLLTNTFSNPFSYRSIHREICWYNAKLCGSHVHVWTYYLNEFEEHYSDFCNLFGIFFWFLISILWIKYVLERKKEIFAFYQFSNFRAKSKSYCQLSCLVLSGFMLIKVSAPNKT